MKKEEKNVNAKDYYYYTLNTLWNSWHSCDARSFL